MYIVYFSTLNVQSWDFLLARTALGLCFVSASLNKEQELSNWMKKHLPSAKLIKDDLQLAPYKKELLAYLYGTTTTFQLPLDMYGTTFQQKVWTALKTIPYGNVVTYQDVAEQIGNKNAVRAVASSIGKNPLLIFIPCHRVIRKNGKLGGFRGGIAMKKALLQLEQRFNSMIE